VVLGHELAAGRGLEPPAGLVDRCAGTFAATDGDIGQTLRCIVTSPEFFSRAAGTKSVALSGLAGVIGLALGAPEFQRK
jgi:uncharacterized protein (DUF1800 family)